MLAAVATVLALCQPPTASISDATCPVTVAGLDTSCANNYTSVYFGETSLQTFRAPQRAIRKITVWRAASQDSSLIGINLRVLATDGTGFPLVSAVVLDGHTQVVPYGDGVHPVRFDFLFDPPALLPSPGTYCLALQADPCWGSWTLLVADRSKSPTTDYPDGSLWFTGKYGCPDIRPPVQFPQGDLIFQVEFCIPWCTVANEGDVASLSCPPGSVVSDILFASYGNPTGTCEGFQSGSCESPASRQIVENACLGQPGCSVPASSELFGDPCPGQPKRLAILASYHRLAPDLRITRVQVPAGIADPMLATYTVANFGSVRAGPFYTEIKLSPDSVDTQPALLWSKGEQGLGPGDSVTVAGFLTLPTDGSGRYMQLRVDARNQVDEQLESNNDLQIPFVYAPPSIRSIQDVPNDEGGAVTVRFQGSVFDDAASPAPVRAYEVYRHDRNGPWELVASTPALGLGEYALDVKTEADSTASSGPAGRTDLFVRATTADTTAYFDSPLASGASVDNLAPAPPARFQAAYYPNRVALSWGTSPAKDVQRYRLYRMLAAPKLITETADTTYADSAGNVFTHYGLTAVDAQGNESAMASTAFSGSVHLGLQGATPNPVTHGPITVTFMLQTSRPARLELIDVAGRRVEAREVGGMGPGLHSATLGSDLQAGIYFVRLVREDRGADSVVGTKRVVVLR